MSKIAVTIFRLTGLIALRQIIEVERGDKTVDEKIYYSGGSNSGNTFVGGRYISRDQAITKAIKESRRFTEGQIEIEREYEEEYISSETESDKDSNSGTSGGNVYAETFEDVTNSQQAKEKLVSLGAEADKLPTAAADLAAYAKSKSISFPNWAAFTSLNK